MNTIYVAGYPKSGTTWMTRLLGDILNCPTGGFRAADDKNEIATEGADRANPRNMIVRKGHYIPSDRDVGPIILPNLELAYRLMRFGDDIIFVIRDPRDIAVSGAHHWNVPVSVFVDDMIAGTGGVRALGPWDNYMYEWTTSGVEFHIVRYRDLHNIWLARLSTMMVDLAFPVEVHKIEEAYERQSFDRRVADIKKHGDYYPRGREFNMRFMRSGVVGDWTNHFDHKTAKKLHERFWWMMERHNFESNENWWKHV